MCDCDRLRSMAFFWLGPIYSIWTLNLGYFPDTVCWLCLMTELDSMPFSMDFLWHKVSVEIASRPLVW